MVLNVDKSSSFSLEDLDEDNLEVEWFEFVSKTLVELVLEFNPMETEGVEDTLKVIHCHEHKEGDTPEDWPKDDRANDSCSICFALWTVVSENKVPEHFRKLGMCKRQGPESKIRSSVGNSSEDELDGLNHLMDEHFSESVVAGWLLHGVKGALN